MKIVFFGTPEFAVCSLDAIVSHGYDVEAVVTVPDRKGGRGNKLIESDVKKYAESKGLRILQPERLRDPEFLKILKEIQADLFVVIAFRMLPEVVWRLPRIGTFNLHASLLPDLRGAAPINHAIIKGKKKTGVTTFFINEEIDKGNILLTSETEIKSSDDAGSLHDRLMKMGAELVINTINGLEKDEIKPLPQPYSGNFSDAPKIFKENCKINFERNAEDIERFVRGLSPYPGAWTGMILEDGRSIEVKIFLTDIEKELNDLKPGEAKKVNKNLYAGTGRGALKIMSIQPSGKKRMEIKEFLAGYNPVKFY